VGGYWILLLDLAAIVPVQYLDRGPIDFQRYLSNGSQSPQDENREMLVGAQRDIEEIKESVAGLRFAVDFDGVELRKPLLLPSVHSPSDRREVAPGEFFVVTFRETVENGAGPLSFRGYLYNQRYSIAPAEFHGINIRVKNTSIGGFDPEFLEYPKHEKLFFQQTMGEIYVDEGLEDAMNIDRATFRIGHAHYSYLQDFLHAKLATLFRESRNRYVRRQRADELSDRDFVLTRLGELWGKPFGLTFSARPSGHPIDIDIESGTATVFRHHPVFQRLGAAERRRRISDLLLFEAAYRKGTSADEVRELLYRLLERRDEGRTP